VADPVSWLLVERGWEVVALDGEKVGRVEEVLCDQQKDIFGGLAVGVGLTGKPRYVPAERVTQILEGRIETDIARDDVDGLPPAP
jgi:sporulation protein YlmC with PRC-barrel domain